MNESATSPPATPPQPSDPPGAASRRRRGHGIATWIAAVSLMALLPMLLFSVVVVYRQITEQQAQALASLQRRATLAAVSVRHELDSVFVELNTMSQAESVLRGDLAATHDLAVRIVQADPRIVSISVTDAAGRQPFISSRPFGTSLPDSASTAAQRPVFERGERVVSPLVLDTVSRQRVVAVAAPLDMGPAGFFAVRAAVRLEPISSRINEQDWPADWTAAVIDQNDVIVARSRDAERYVGQPATEALRAGLKTGQSTFRADTKDGTEVIVSTASVPGTGWHVAVGRPLAALNAQVTDSVVPMLVAGVLCALLAIGLALYLARYVGRELRGVVDRHVRGKPEAGTAGSIREVTELSSLLAEARAQADQALQALQTAREDALAQLQERGEMLDVLAHEVRQPLNNASVALQAATLALNSNGGVPEATRPLRHVAAVISDVRASIDNTLAVASLLARGDRVWREDADIDTLIAVTIADLPAEEVERIRVERATPTRTASMDASLMRLALRNLLANALKYSPCSTPVTVRVADSDEPLALLIDVIDRGPGIPAAQLAPLSERGARRQPATGVRRHGLGLYIVRRVMELHGGSVQVTHNGADGTTMRLVIAQGHDD